MSSFRNNRIVIASLFLPTTAVIGEPSPPPTPDHNVLADSPAGADAKPDLEAAFAGITPNAQGPGTPADDGAQPAGLVGRLAQRTSRPPRMHFASGGEQRGLLKSIVDDLKDKSRAVTPVTTPPNEAANPFGAAVPAPAAAVAAAAARKTARIAPATPVRRSTHTEHASPRVQRKQSRSSSRRPPHERSLSVHSSPDGPDDPPVPPFHFEPNPHCNGGLKNAVDSVPSTVLRRKLWVGTLGTATDGFSDSLRAEIDGRMRWEKESVPVWIPDAEFESCYDEFCHQVLWPALHYAVPDAPRVKVFYESASFKQYKAVNQRFADVICENYQEGDIIWVNDYHLLLLPLLLRTHPKRPLPATAPIGFFMHVAFPSSEIFRCLAARGALLRGLVGGADLVGLQTANHARHFRRTVGRLLGVEAVPRGVWVDGAAGAWAEGPRGKGVEGEFGEGVGAGVGQGQEEEAKEGGRFVDVGVFPMGIDVGLLKERKRDPEVGEWLSMLKQRYAGMKLVVGRDKLDEIQGVRKKIQAFELFLESYPEFRGKVVLIQVALQTTESNELAAGVLDLVSRINSRFSTLTYQPVVFLHTGDLTFAQYLALLCVADAFLVTSYREGMALRTHEYVECQEDRHRPLILSEFTGSYSYSGFRSCIAINPWDIRGVANAIHQALTMSDEEAKSRWEDLHNHVVTQSAQTFVTSFLTRCVRANSEHLQRDPGAVPALAAPRLLPRFRHSPARLLLLDLEETLWRRDYSPAGGAGAGADVDPPAELVRVVKALCEDRRNQVWLLSGLPRKGMVEKIEAEVPKLGIVAENGCFIKTLPTRSGPGQWISMVSSINLSWKTSCIETLQYFSERTPGSSIEEREASIVWRYWTGPAEADPAGRQWARRQAAEAQNHIFDSLGERYGLRIIPGDNSFLVLPNNISRSTAVGALLHPGGPAAVRAAGSPGWAVLHPDGGADVEPAVFGGAAGEEDGVAFILAIGGDEKLLRRLNELDGAETCSTSGKGTDAKWKLDRAEAVSVLWQFANAA